MALEFSDPYRGSPVVPHASEKFFAQYFVGILVCGSWTATQRAWLARLSAPPCGREQGARAAGSASSITDAAWS